MFPTLIHFGGAQIHEIIPIFTQEIKFPGILFFDSHLLHSGHLEPGLLGASDEEPSAAAAPSKEDGAADSEAPEEATETILEDPLVPLLKRMGRGGEKGRLLLKKINLLSSKTK